MSIETEPTAGAVSNDAPPEPSTKKAAAGSKNWLCSKIRKATPRAHTTLRSKAECREVKRLKFSHQAQSDALSRLCRARIP
jgi:hypothetical protein